MLGWTNGYLYKHSFCMAIGEETALTCLLLAPRGGKAYWWPDNGAITAGGCFNTGLMRTWGIKVHWARLCQLLLFKKRGEEGALTGMEGGRLAYKTTLEQAALYWPHQHTAKEAGACGSIEAEECDPTVWLVVLVWLRLVWVIFCWLQVYESPTEQSVFSDCVHFKFDGVCACACWPLPIVLHLLC